LTSLSEGIIEGDSRRRRHKKNCLKWGVLRGRSDGEGHLQALGGRGGRGYMLHSADVKEEKRMQDLY